jgi:membrane protein DedA with SNARE-associated domain
LIAKAEEQMHRWGLGVVLIGRCIPGIRTLISIPAGLAKIPFLKFFVATFIGAYVWCMLLIGAGYILGYEWRLISEYIKTHLPLVFGLGGFAILLYMAYHFREQLSAIKWFKTTRTPDTDQ